MGPQTRASRPTTPGCTYRSERTAGSRRCCSGDGTDTIVFGYKVQSDDVDADGISVEGGGPGTGLYYSETNRDGGIWAVEHPDGRINRLFHGLDDDPAHVVAQVEVEEPTIEEPTDIDDGATTTLPTPEGPFVSAPSISVGLIESVDGELTDEDGGRDWYGVDVAGGENYIIELKNTMEFIEDDTGNTWLGFHLNYVDGHLIDPSILEVVDDQGEQVLGEHDQGGFMGNFARAFFTPENDGTYYIAVGAGNNDRGGTGFYALSVRVDDHPDDYGLNPGVVLQPGDSITAAIDSDVAPDDPGLNQWDWAVASDESVPVFGVESLDDRDVFRLEISEEGTYEVSVSDGPTGVGIWSVFNDRFGLHADHPRSGPVESIVCDFEPGTYHVEVGTPHQSVGNTGSYTVSLDEVADDTEVATAA